MNKMPENKSKCCDWPVVSLKGKDGQGYTMCPQCCEHLSKCCGAEIEEIYASYIDSGGQEVPGSVRLCSKCHRPVDVTPKEES